MIEIEELEIPMNICEVCGEFLPHYCAPIIVRSRQVFSGKRLITITDRHVDR